MTNVQSATATLKQTATRVDGMVGDIQERQLPEKIDEAMTRCAPRRRRPTVPFNKSTKA